MSEYVKYQHVERLGNDEVDGILFGDVYVFPKIDGTNAHIWWDNGLRYGSRKRELSLEKDNAGFMQWASNKDWKGIFAELPEGSHIFGEWLVPHSLKTYREDAWRDFYIFDIVLPNETYMIYEEYQPILDKLGLNYIMPLRIITNPQIDNIIRVLEDNTFLIEDGKGIGEGVVLKNYAYQNKYGRQTWAKVVTSEFKEKHNREMGAPITKGTDFIEEKIIEEFLSDAMIDKVYAKISLERWSSSKIPKLLGIVWHDLITECIWDALKKFKNPKIDFKILNRFAIIKIKKHKPELF